MRQSQYFLKTSKTAPADDVTVNAKLLEQAGFVEKLMAGVYSYSPLGLRVLRKIEDIIRQEMNAVGGQELLMPMLHPKAIWQKTGGWKKIDVLFKLKSRTEKDFALGQSEEEVVTPLVMKRINSYKDLPVAVYQIHWKFRDELRSKSGILRGVEFLMKDMYSFHESQEDFEKYYEIVKKAYLKIYQRLGLTAKVTEGSGGSFTQKISYEFMVLTDAGEDDILYCDVCEYCVNVEIAKQKAGENCPKCEKGKLNRAKASEVGNVFDLGQKYGKDFDLGFTDQNGEKKYPIMGCYGLGLTRLMGVIVEKFNDEKGIIWPKSVAPFLVHLLALKAAEKETDKIYQDLLAAGVEVLYDDREVSAGVKFADSDLIGIPYRVVVSERTLEKAAVEVKKRSENEAQLINITKLTDAIK